jgi:hypothetical protein
LLSRREPKPSLLPQDHTLLALSAPSFDDFSAIINECSADPSMSIIINAIQHDPSARKYYTYDQETLRYKGRIVVPPTSIWRTKILHEYHSTQSAGHSRFLCTYKRLQTDFYWPGMKTDINFFIAQCEISQRNKAEAVAPSGVLNLLPIPMTYG